MLAFWLLYQSAVVSLLVLTVFLVYRSHLHTESLKHQIDMTTALLVTFAIAWGNDPVIVRRMLDDALRIYKVDPKHFQDTIRPGRHHETDL
jgi:hypothetical protein